MLFLCCAGFASAELTIQLDMARLYTAGGSSQVADGTIGVLVANTSGGGFGQGASLVGAELSAGQLLGGNRILGTLQAFDVSDAGDFGFGQPVTVSDFTGMTFGSSNGSGGTELAVYWFPGITTAGSIVSEGQSYGYFRSDTVDIDAGSNISFNLPADGGNYSLVAYETDLGGSFDAANFQANSVAGIPEPSRMILAMLGFVGLMFRRRR